MHDAPAPPVPPSPYRRMLIASGVLLALALGYALSSVLVPLFLAFLVAYALDPLVDRLEEARVPRTVGAIAVMGGLLTIALGVLAFAVPYLVDEFRAAGEALPDQLIALGHRAEPWLARTLHVRLPHTWEELGAKLAAELEARAPAIAQGATVALFGTLDVILIVVGSLIIPVFALYLLIDFDRNAERARDLVPRRWAPLVESVAREVHRTLGGYVRGQLLACFVLATLYALALRVVGLRLALPIGAITGLLAFVPYVGFGLGMLMALGMALLDWRGADHLLAVAGVMLAVQLLDGMLVTPRIVGRSVGLKPIEVLLTMMAAATLFGFLGVLLAVPLGAVVKILVGRATQTYLASDFYGAPPATRNPTLTPAASPVEPPARAS